MQIIFELSIMGIDDESYLIIITKTADKRFKSCIQGVYVDFYHQGLERYSLSEVSYTIFLFWNQHDSHI